MVALAAQAAPTAKAAPLKDHVALISGGGSDIGRAIARQLAGLGVRLCLVGRRPEPLEATAEGLADAQVCAVDLTSERGPQFVHEETARHFGGRLDILVHCAGVYCRAPIEQATAEDFDRQFAANVRAPYRLTQALLPMLEESRGQIVFINSTQGQTVGPLLSQYAATQHALRGFADGLRAEVNERGVRVLTVHLGRTATERQRSIFRAEGRPYRPELLLQPEDVAIVIGCCVTLPLTAEVTSLNLRPMIKSY